MRSALVRAIPGCIGLAVLAVLLPAVPGWAGDDPSIKGNLRKEIHALETVGLLLKDFNEEVADDFALLLRIAYAPERFEKTILCIDIV